MIKRTLEKGEEREGWRAGRKKEKEGWQAGKEKD